MKTFGFISIFTCIVAACCGDLQPLYTSFCQVIKRPIHKRLTFTVSTVFFALLFFTSASVGQNHKLKNVSGTFQVNAGSWPIDSVYQAISGSVAAAYFTEVFIVYYTKNGKALSEEFDVPKLRLDGSGISSGGVFSTTDKHDGKGGVSCSYINSTFNENVNFSYSRFKPHLTLATKPDSSETWFGSDPFATPARHFNFHLFVDGSLDDVDSSFVLQYSDFKKLYIVTDVRGKQVYRDSSKHFPGAFDTVKYCPTLPPGRYLAQFSFVADTLSCIPDTGISFHFIINQGIYQSQCNGLPWLKFDATHSNVADTIESPAQGGKGWQGGSGIGIIQDSGTIFINNILRFHGIMQIDTINGSINADGEFYVWTLLPFGLYSGPFSLGTGNWPIIYKCNGLVTTAQILSSSSIGGFKFRFDSIYFYTDSLGVSGVRLGATVRLPNVTIGATCGSNFNSKTSPDISIAPIEITQYGIGGALHVSNVGFGDAFCVKDLFGSYYEAPDSLSFGAEFKAPFVDKLALSAGWVHGVWDAISFNVQQATGGIPIGETTMLLSGVRGSASGWTNGPLKCSIGGTFDNVVPNLMRWEGDVSYNEPSTLKGSLTLKFLNVVDWQLVMNATATLDWDHYVKFEGSLKEGTLGNGYVFNGKGSLTYIWSPKKDLIGSGSGSYSLPKLGKPNLSALTDWINSFLPVNIASAEMQLKDRVVKGNISFWIISAHLAVDLNLPYTDPNFIDFGRGTIPLNIAHPKAKNQIASLTLDSIHMPASTAFAIIRIRSNGLPSASSLIDPSNKTHTNMPGDSLVVYTTDPITNHGFWAMKNPAAGVWKLSMPQRMTTDTVDAQAEPMEEPLQFTATQNGKHVTLRWTPLSGGETADVTAYLDDSNNSYKGFLRALTNDKDGTLTFDLNDSLPLCQYYLYAARDNSAYISQSYSTLTLDNSKTSALAPSSLTLKHLGGDSILLTWTPTTSIGLLGYIIKVTDANGSDSMYGSVSIGRDSAVIVVQNPQGKHISLDAYGNGIQSCWSQSVSTSSSVPTRNNTSAVATLDLQVWPNPNTGKGEFNFTLSERNMIRITIFDLLGNEISTPVQSVLDEGKHTSTFNFGTLPTGTYYCRAQFMGRVETVKIAVEH